MTKTIIKYSFIVSFLIMLVSFHAGAQTPVKKITVEQFLKMSSRDTSTCELTGTVTRVRSYGKGRLFLDDGTGSVLIFNVIDIKDKRSFSEIDVRPGDILTVCGRRYVYDGRVIEMKAGRYISHTEGPDHDNVIKKDMPDKDPTFKGEGIEEFQKWVLSQLKVSESAKKGLSDRTVNVKFVVGMNGLILEPEIVSGGSPAINEEIIRVIKSSPKWKPAKTDGSAVRVTLDMPIVL